MLEFLKNNIPSCVQEHFSVESCEVDEAIGSASLQIS